MDVIFVVITASDCCSLCLCRWHFHWV